MTVIITGSNTPTAGGVTYGDGSTYVTTAAGSAGQVLTSAGTSAPTWATVSAGFTLGTPVSVAGVSSVTITGIPSTAKVVYINFQNVLYAANDTFYVQLGTSAGIEVTDYVYARSTIASSAASAFASTTATGFGITNGQSDIVWGTVTLTLENSATNTWNMTGLAGKSTLNYFFSSSGYKSLTSVLSQMSISAVNGNNWTSGQINISYI